MRLYGDKMLISKRKLNEEIVILLLFALGGGCIYSYIEVENTTWLFYFAMMFIFFIVSFVVECLKKKSIIQYCILSVVFSFPMAFRYNMAIDDYSYKRIFTEISTHEWGYLLSRQEEVGYLIVEKLISILFADYYINQALIIILPTVLIMIYVYKNENRINITFFFLFFYLVLYYKFMAAGLNRMYIAMTIVLHSYEYLYKHDLCKYILLVCVASLFHISALIMLIFIPIVIKDTLDDYVKNWRRYYYIILTLLFAMGYSVYNTIANLLSGRYAQYFGAGFSINIDISSLLRIILFLFLIVLARSKKESNSYINSIFPIYYSSVLVDIFWSNLVLGRVIYYFELAVALSWAHIITKERKVCNKFVFLTGLSCYLWIIFFATIIKSERLYDSLFPYISFLQ